MKNKTKQQKEGENLFWAIVKVITLGLVSIRSATLTEDMSNTNQARLTIFLSKKKGK